MQYFIIYLNGYSTNLQYLFLWVIIIKRSDKLCAIHTKVLNIARLIKEEFSILRKFMRIENKNIEEEQSIIDNNNFIRNFNLKKKG